MSRVRDAILNEGVGYTAGRLNPMLNLEYGGQQGYAPDLTEWVSNQAYIRKNLFCLLVEAPKGFSYLPNPDAWVGTLRALVELHPMSITGLAAGLEVEVTENAVGGAGEMQQDFTDVKRARSNPVFRWNEKYGMPVSSFLEGWITYLMMDPASKYPNVVTLSGRKPTDMLADQYAASMIFIEPDMTHSKPVKAWLCTNMFPMGTGEVVGSRELTAAGEPTTYDINFTAITQYGAGVLLLAERLLAGINITGANPYQRPAFLDSIDADVLAARKGYQSQVEDLGSQAIPL
jgi:hypothetical protein